MRLNAPKKIVWLISLILAILSIISLYVAIPFVSAHAFWVMAVAWLFMFLGTVLKGF
jgi:hypothetical protein